MASKDQSIGALIFLICLFVAIVYVIALLFPEALLYMLVGAGRDPEVLQFWLVAIPVLIAFVGVLFIGAWIGWTMATTPPPKPLEEIEAEETAEAEEEKPEPTPEAKTEEEKEA